MAHPPAWYRDPRDPARVRRWDGSAWTDEVRPLPDWLRTLQLSAGPAAGSPSTSTARSPRRSARFVAARSGSSRLLWATSVALLLAGGLVMAFLGLGERTDDPDRISDRSFARAADARCAATGKSLGPGTRRVLDGEAEVARIERIASAWELTAVDLRALPVASADARRVDDWLDTWDQWVALGYDYAEGLRTGDEEAARDALAAAAPPRAQLRRFAVVNGMGDCAFG